MPHNAAIQAGIQAATQAGAQAGANVAIDAAKDRPLVWIDGRLVPKSQATVSVFDHGLLYGDGVFEGIRMYNGRVFKCASHVERLFRSAERIRLKIPHTKDEVALIIKETLRANGMKDAYIRLVVTRGAGSLGLNPNSCPRPGVICICDNLRLYPEQMYRDGMKIVVAERPRIPIDCLDPRIKSLNYLNNILGKLEAIDAGVLEALMLNTKGYVAECTGDNIFVIKGGKVSTPPSDAGILEGVTRAFVMGLCAELRIPCEERMMRLDEVLGAEEVFLTGTGAEIIAVTAVGDTVIGSGKEGAVTKRIRERFREVVSENAPED